MPLRLPADERDITPPPSVHRRITRACAHAASPTDLSMMRQALALAASAGASGEIPVGAIVYETLTGRVLSQCANTREHTRDPAGHAEFLAMRKAAEILGDWRLNTCTLVVTLEPCPMCAGMIVNARIGRVVFGVDDPKAGAVCSLYELLSDPRLNHRPQVIAGVMAGESRALLREFFRARRVHRHR